MPTSSKAVTSTSSASTSAWCCRASRSLPTTASRIKKHIVVGAGDGPCVLLGVGGRVGPSDPVYPVDPVALLHGAGVEHETAVPKEAYSPFPENEPVPFREDFLPS